MKLEPRPKLLFTLIEPSLNSINSLQSINPKPVPFSFSVPGFESLFDGSNSFTMSSGSIPTPLSEMKIIEFSESLFDDISITPFRLVNLIAFDNKFLMTILSVFMSESTRKLGSTLL